MGEVCTLRRTRLRFRAKCDASHRARRILLAAAQDASHAAECSGFRGTTRPRDTTGAQGCALTATQRYPRYVMIVDVDPERLREVCERYGVASLEVFGSAARNEDRRDSDVDLLYVLKPHARLGFSLFDLEDELAALFGRPVDLVSRKAINKYIREQVLADAQPLYAA